MSAVLPSLLLALCLVSLPAQAQKNGPVTPTVPPPKLEPLPEIKAPPGAVDDLEPAVTIRRKGNDTLEEYRRGGKVYMIKVTPGNGLPPYYLIDQDGSGRFLARDAAGNPMAVPQWLLFEF
ncbi:DUF2782 domain-containing protein [Parvibium lacunae]|uniref:DUF2782 domain-containing protein n=2 Tax=Parvibium lacunae TaxID=1888893 RepID=A0A368L6E6_9BURK|nr:DUF2782 domain-containing protein [Parvibium lacunae]